jgi:Zn-dependent protease/CBS domain-containing protein
MRRQHFYLGRVAGIPIGLDSSWFVIFALVAWVLARNYYPAEFPLWSQVLCWTLGIATSALLFVSVLLHELGHAMLARAYRIPVRRITLFIFGGVAEIGGELPGPLAEFLVAIAGPVVSFALAAGFDVLKVGVAGSAPLYALAEYLAFINGALALFNLIPAFPLDGGRVFRAMVWALTRDVGRATVVAATVGRGFAFLFVAFGAWEMYSGRLFDGLWIAFIGWFLNNAAQSSQQERRIEHRLSGHTVGQVMEQGLPTVDGAMTLATFTGDRALSSQGHSYVVTGKQGAIGLMTLEDVARVPVESWGETTAADIMQPFDHVPGVSADTEVWRALQQMDRIGVNQLMVVAGGQIAGMLSRHDVLTFLRNLG